MVKKTLENYKKVWARKCKKNNPKFNRGLKLGLRGTTNSKKIHNWLNKVKC